jgi:hypothetical protein
VVLAVVLSRTRQVSESGTSCGIIGNTAGLACSCAVVEALGTLHRDVCAEG